jgi:hypothetical protein
METILLVTWFVLGELPTHYQVKFGSPGACAQARIDLLREETRLRAEAKPEMVGNMEVAGPPAPRLSAVCAPLK